MKPTIYTIAQKAGVSIATVSRVFNHQERVSPDTKKKVMDIAEVLGYYPNANARGLSQKATDTIALVLPQTSDPFFSEIVRGVEASLRSRDYHLLIYTCEDLDDEKEMLSFLPTRTEAMILAAYFSTGSYLRRLKQHDFPFLLLGQPPKDIKVHALKTDEQATVKRLMRHLIETHGYRDIAILSGPDDQRHSLNRLRGYLDALSEHQIPLRESWIAIGNFDEKSGHEQTLQLLQQKNPPRAIFAANDRMAIGAMAAASELKVKVPDDLALVGFDDLPSSRYMNPPLTTVSVDPYRHGKLAVEHLFMAIEQDLPPQQKIITVPIVLRQSCGCSGPQRK